MGFQAFLGTSQVAATTPADWTVGQAVLTSSGLVYGQAASNVSDVSEYLGIPYAVPPVESLRFQPPVPYTGEGLSMNATSYGLICMQVDMFAGLPSNLPITPAGYELLQEYSADTPAISEDCLTLNVWTKPQTGDEKKAVMVSSLVHGAAATPGIRLMSISRSGFTEAASPAAAPPCPSTPESI